MTTLFGATTEHPKVKKEMARLNKEIAALRAENQQLRHDLMVRETVKDDVIAELRQDLQTTADTLAEVERIELGLQNCRLFAARHRKDDWALMILGFCAEAGEVGSITR